MQTLIFRLAIPGCKGQYEQVDLNHSFETVTFETALSHTQPFLKTAGSYLFSYFMLFLSSPTPFISYLLYVLLATVLLLCVCLIAPKLCDFSKIKMPKMRNYILGHAAEFMDPKYYLRALMKWHKQLGDVFAIWIVHQRVIVTANAKDINIVLGRNEIFERPASQTKMFNDLQPDNFQTMQRHTHAAQRSRMRTALSPNLIENHEKTMTHQASILVDVIKKASNGDPNKLVDLTPILADTTFRVLLATILGADVEEEERNAFAKESRDFLGEMFREISTYPIRRMFRMFGLRRRLFRKHRAVKEFAGRLVDKRKSETKEQRENRPLDMMDIILEVEPNSLERQIGNVVMFAIAGFESSSEALAWAIYEISGKPEVADKIRTELKAVLGDKKDYITFDEVKSLTYLKSVWDETLRLHPASGFLIRQAKTDTTLPGSKLVIRKGVQVGALIAGAQRNEKLFKNPSSFHPGRHIPPSSLLAFSAGPERCPGRPLADYEGVVILAHLFQSFDMELGCAREDIVSISDWAERAKSPAPGAAKGDLSWTVPIKFKERK